MFRRRTRTYSCEALLARIHGHILDEVKTRRINNPRAGTSKRQPRLVGSRGPIGRRDRLAFPVERLHTA